MRFRVIIALIASTYILIHAHPLDVIARAFVTPSFYLALAVSYPITLILVYAVHRVTLKLDKLHDWRNDTVERIVWQCVFAVILPSLIDLGLISIYSAIVDGNFFPNTFILVDFPIIVSFIILLNMYYVIYYLLLTEPKPKVEKVSNILSDVALTTLTIDYGGVFVKLNPKDDILCFYRSGKLVKVVTNNREYAIRDSIGALELQYLNEGFLRLNRSTIINMRIVQGFTAGIKRDTLSILLNEPIEVLDPQIDLFVVTEKYIHSFKAQLQAR